MTNLKGIIRKCDYCGAEYTTKTTHHRFCSTKCRVKAYRKAHGITVPDFTNYKTIGLGHTIKQKYKDAKKEQLEILDLYTELNRTIKEFFLFIKQPYTSIEIDNLYDYTVRLFPPDSYTSVKFTFDTVFLKKNKFEFPNYYKYKHDYEQDEKFINNITKALKDKLDYYTDKQTDLNNYLQQLESGYYSSPVVRTEKDTPVLEGLNDDDDDIQILNPKLLKNIQHKVIKLQDKELYSIFGDFTSNAKISIWGDAGSGKTSLVLRLVNYLREYGNVVFITSEHELTGGEPILKKLDRYKLDDLPMIPVKSIKQVMRALRQTNYQFYIVDSITRLNVNADTYTKLLRASQKASKCFIGIHEATKGGKELRGGNQILHASQIVMKVSPVIDDDSITGAKIEVQKNEFEPKKRELMLKY